MKKALAFLLALCGFFLCCAPLPARTETAPEEEDFSIVEFVELDEDNNEILVTPVPAPEMSAAKAAFIEDIIALGQELYEKTEGKLRRAHYASDIFVCKNFTVYLFRQTRDRYRIAEFPTVQLKIPNNLPAAKCKPYAYGYCWEDIPASKGNPFEIAAQFLYDTNLTKEENNELALAFMRQVRRGDYFQMTANYSHGVGAHSAIMISDYDPVSNTVHWMDSNMVGRKIDGIRYGKVQFDEEVDIQWWVDAFCQKKRGATLYRLRDDIIFAE